MQRSRLKNIINKSNIISNKQEVGNPFDKFKESLPIEIDDNYRLEAAWKAYGSPKDYKQALWEGMIQPIDENNYKLPSIGYNEETDEYEYLNKGKDNDIVAKDIRVWDNDVIPFVKELKLGGFIRIYDDEKDCFSDFKEIIKEDYHLSYPFVFNGDDGNIYIMPESNEANELYLYRAMSFPDKWEKYMVILDNIRVVDTTPFDYIDNHYAFSLELDDNMLLLEFDSDYNIMDKALLSNDMSFARAGGRVFDHNGKQIYVAQDCREEYGKAINLIEFDLKDKCFNHNLIKTINPEDVELINAKKASGIHTYNFSNKLEVIDLKYYRNSY